MVIFVKKLLHDLISIENDLAAEIKLEPLQIKMYLLINCHGQMSLTTIAERLEIPTNIAQKVANELVDLGGFIDMPDTEFEAMHPRFTAVNMYRRMCERENIEFKRNNIVDNIGAVLEKFYDDARTK